MSPTASSDLSNDMTYNTDWTFSVQKIPSLLLTK